MASPYPPSTWRRKSAILCLFVGLPFLPAACGSSADIVFVGSGSGGLGGDAGNGGEAGEGGAGGTTETGGTGGGSGGTILTSCGDERTDDGEDCDEGLTDTADCDGDCTEAVCGDGHTNEAADEACDSEGIDSADCNADCSEATCGDRHTNEASGEECDDGGEPSPSCDSDCTLPECGDGLVHAPTGELCDDGNNEDGDGCTSTCVRELLILGDGVSETDAASLLREAGFAVTVAPVLEYEFDGTNPVLDEFCGVIQFDGTYTVTLPQSGQQALVDYVEAGGSFMNTGWSGYEAQTYGTLGAMSDLLLLGGVTTGPPGNYTQTPEGATHPVTSDLPASFSGNGSGEAGTCKADATALLLDGTSAVLCVDEEVGAGRALSLGHAFSYAGARPLVYPEMSRLLVNAANWMCATNHPFPTMTPGSTAVVNRFGYAAQCNSWVDNVCMEPYITMNEADVSDPVPHCIDDTTSLRPIWFGEATTQAAAWCWIATGSSSYVSAVQGSNSAYSGGWMYGGVPGYSTPTCDDGAGRHISQVDIPVAGSQVWSFDDFAYVRSGAFSNFECIWGPS